MHFLKALLLPALVGAALALSAVVLGPASAPFALLLNAFVLSQVVGSTQVWSVTLPESYFRLRRVERGGHIYTRVGILFFKRLMTSRLYRAFNPHFNFKRGSLTARDLRDRMQDAEAAHALVFGLMACCSAFALAVGSVSAAFWLLLFNVLGNAYPVMLQRYNRGRLQRLFVQADLVASAPTCDKH